MITYTFDELSESAQAHAVSLYAGEAFNEAVADGKSPKDVKDTDVTFAGWRFAVTGERIA